MVLNFKFGVVHNTEETPQYTRRFVQNSIEQIPQHDSLMINCTDYLRQVKPLMSTTFHVNELHLLYAIEPYFT